MPTTPMKATPLRRRTPIARNHRGAFEMIHTAPFDISHQPGESLHGDGGRTSDRIDVDRPQFRRADIYGLPHAFEQSGDWTRM